MRLTFENTPPDFPQALVAKAIGHVERSNKPLQNLSVRFVVPAEMTTLHESFKGQPGPTNVLTFADSGEIAICPMIAAKDARIRGWDEMTELIYLCVHGSLHALGFDHKCQSEAARMRDYEIRALSELGIDTSPLKPSRD